MCTQIRIDSILKSNESIVISGISGRFPESDSVDELAKNLFGHIDMAVVDDRRWNIGKKLKFLYDF